MFGSKNNLVEIIPQVRGKYLKNVPLSKHTWLGVGGPAEVMFVPEDIDDLAFFLKNKPYNVPVCLIGGGSNLLVRDGGVPGVVIKLDSPFFKQVVIAENQLTCFAGFKNAELKKVMLDNHIGGLEFLSSIPGVIGGSVKTNAGCYGKEIKDVAIKASVIDDEGKIQTIGVDDLQLSYRHSLFPDDWIITSITFKTYPDTPANIQKTLDDQKAYRQKTQPYNERSAGSAFKNPEGLRAWELIKKTGADQLRIGGAKVSEKHANFLINTGKATARDLEDLGEAIRKLVKEKTLIDLEWEIKRLGIFKP